MIFESGERWEVASSSASSLQGRKMIPRVREYEILRRGDMGEGRVYFRVFSMFGNEVLGKKRRESKEDLYDHRQDARFRCDFY